MKSNAFGLDIGATKIKAVWLNRDNGLLSYNSAMSVANTSPGIQSESPFDHQELAQTINKLVLDAKITTNKVNIALPEHHIFTKVIDMPVLSDKELSSAIYWEAEEYIPAAIDTMTLDWIILKKPKEIITEKKMQVLLVAAPNKLIKRYQTILELAGLSIVAVETETLSIIRGVTKSNNSLTSLLVNIGSLNTSLSIIQNGVIVFNYSIPLGGIVLTHAISSNFGLNVDQAEEYKKTYGFSDKSLEGKVGMAIEPIFANIITEVKKAIAFYTEKYKNESPISQVILTGGTANLPGLDVYFVKKTGIETVTANTWKMLDIANVPKPLEPLGPEYVIACGLAIKEYE
ncbi:MAG TPA: type IV pilus assembly protein PilM [Candidatus Saccharimonadales bacterium]|nr:type IV pilus assembly protein PilM [Candidatus Saccharimonadales bacterium]